MLVGKVVKSNSHVDYVVQVFAPGEVSNPPRPEDHAFGRFVRIALEDGRDELIGIIYDTLLLNPAYGTLGPRLSGEPHLTAFAPDYLPETSTLVGVAVVGWRRGEGSGASCWQGVPPVAARVGAETSLLDDEGFAAFHRDGGMARVAYLPRLASMGNLAMPELLNSLLTRLIELFPQNAGTLSVLRSNLQWNTRLPRK